MRDVVKQLNSGHEFGLEDIDDCTGTDGQDRVGVSFIHRKGGDHEYFYVDRSDLLKIKDAIEIHLNLK